MEQTTSYFNLRRDNRPNDIQFDGDEVTVSDIKRVQAPRWISDFLNSHTDLNACTEDEINEFKGYFKYVGSEAFYKPTDNTQLLNICKFVITNIGKTCTLNWLDVSEIHDFSQIFADDVTKKFNGDISKWDMSQATSLSEMFLDSDFNGDISEWNVSNVRLMSWMFSMSEFNGDISKWDVSHVTTMNDMFYNSKFNGDISKWDVSNVTNMSSMFKSSEFSGDISDWDVSKVAQLDYLFANTKFNGDISGWNTKSAIKLDNMFESNREFNQPIGNWNTSNVTSMKRVFHGAFAFNQDISKWDVSRVLCMTMMFDNAKSFNQDLSDWHTYDTVISSGIFDNCPIKKEFYPPNIVEYSLDEGLHTDFNLKADKANDVEFDNDQVSAEQIKHTEVLYRMRHIAEKIIFGGLKNEDADFFAENFEDFKCEPLYKVKPYEGMAEIMRCIRFNSLIDITEFNWLDVSQVTDMSHLFDSQVVTNIDISKWDVSNVKNMGHMFADANFAGDISEWDTHNVESMDHLFYKSDFNGDISKWDVSNVTDMTCMFYKADFNGDISKWDTHNVKSMCNMFTQSPFDGDISNWDVSSVEDMSCMFYGAAFDGNIENWDVSNVYTMMEMFYNTKYNQPLGKWAIKPNVNTYHMFGMNFFFDQDLSSWTVKSTAQLGFGDRVSGMEKKRMPKTAVAKSLDESYDDFRLKANKPSDVQFDDDSVHTDEIDMHRRDYVQRCISQLISKHTLSDAQRKIFLNYISEHDDLLYAPDELIKLKIVVYAAIQCFGNEVNLNWIDTSKITSLYLIFSNSEFNGDISKWNVSNCQDMAYAFADSKFNGDISGWDMSSVTTIRGMFSNSKFNGDISKWDVSKCDNMAYAFQRAKFNGDISKWDMTACDKMHGMFFFNKAFNQPIGNWDVSHVKSMSHMFHGAVFNQPIGDWNVSACTDFSNMFDQSEFNQSIVKWPISDHADVSQMFTESAIELANKPAIFQQEDKRRMLLGEQQMSNFNIRGTGHTRDIDFDDDNAGAKQIHDTQFIYTLRKNADILLNEGGPECEAFFKDHKDQIDKLVGVYHIVGVSYLLSNLINKYTKIVGYKCSLNWIDVSEITEMSHMFYMSSFNGDISKWNVSNVKSMAQMFWRSSFNGDISKWDVSNVEEMYYMFHGSNFNGDISEWDVSHVKDMSYMFGESVFNNDISKWDVSSVEKMSHMFKATHFNKDISRWDVSSVIDMGHMFEQSHFTGDISDWNVSNVRNMYGMFSNAEFRGDISKWKINDRCSVRYMFYQIDFPREHKPEALQNIRESFSSFNLKKSEKVRDVDFTDDEMDSSDIQDNRLDFIVKIVSKMLTDTVTDQNIRTFKEYLKHYDKPFYKVETKDELRKLVIQCSKYLGNECDLNWLDVSGVRDMSELFYQTDFNGDISKWDVSGCWDMSCMFSMTKFNGDISNWNVSEVYSMRAMFRGSEFNGDISKWNVSGVTRMSFMFRTSEFNGDLSKWDVSNVVWMDDAFSYSKFTGDISNWNVSKVSDASFMFQNSVFDGDISNWDLKSLKKATKMFDKCPISEEHKPNLQTKLLEAVSDFNLRRDNGTHDVDFDDDEVTIEEIKHKETLYRLKNVVIPKILNGGVSEDEERLLIDYVSAHDDILYTVKSRMELDYLIQWSINNIGKECNLNWIDVSNITDMNNLFSYDADALLCIRHTFNGDISTWDVSNVEDMRSMFYGSSFNGDISTWDVSNVKYMGSMFGYSTFDGDISQWDVNNAKYIWTTFHKANIKEEHKPKAWQNLRESMSNFNLRRDNETHDVDFDDDEVGASDVEMHRKEIMPKVMREIIDKMLDGTITPQQAKRFYNYTKTYQEPLYKVSDAEELRHLIKCCCEYLGYDCDLNWIDVSSITEMFERIGGGGWGVFQDSPFNGDISKWDVSNVTNFKSMFENSQFNGDISNWKLKSAKILVWMFESSKFNGDISKWDVSNVWTMEGMFAHSEFNADISKWDVSHVKNMKYTFTDSQFNGDISKWNLKSLEKAAKMFEECPISEEHKPIFPEQQKDICEAVSNFNLRRSKPNDIDFDNDGVSTDSIKNTEMKYRLCHLAQKIVDHNISEEEIHFFRAHYLDIREPYYTVQSKDDLRELIRICLLKLGNECDLNWIDVSQITSMSMLFNDSEFNGDISEWDVSNVTDMEYMFYDSWFNGDISKWDVSNVRDMRWMFYNATEFDTDISDWTINNCLVDFMFKGANISQQHKPKCLQ